MSVIVYGHPASTYTRSVRMAARELDVPIELRLPPFGTPEHDALHPWRKMPALSDGAHTVFEALACIAWLDRDRARLIPAAPELRVAVLQWCSALVDYVYDPVVGLGHLANGAATPDEAIAAAEATLDRLEAAWSRWPSGEVSAADLVLFPMLDYARSVDAFARSLGARPHLAAFHARIGDRPSATETRP